MVISRDLRSKFGKFLFCPNSTFNIKKSHKISDGKGLYFRSYQPKNFTGGWKTPPPPVPLELILQCLYGVFFSISMIHFFVLQVVICSPCLGHK